MPDITNSMLKHITGLKWIGDVSLEDADVLVGHGQRSKNILEFGSGGSTQLLAQCRPDSLISVETDPRWISVTKNRLAKINGVPAVDFRSYTVDFDQEFDLIFVDGVDHLRREFAIQTWRYLRVGGVMLFHDTRRFQDFQNVAWVAQLYFNEISKVDVNAPATNNQTSNMSVIYKKSHEPYVNWNHTENKPAWAYGTLDSEQELCIAGWSGSS